MTGLRFALLLIGVVIVAAVYWHTRRKSSPEGALGSAQARIEPGFSDLDEPESSAQLEHQDATFSFDEDTPLEPMVAERANAPSLNEDESESEGEVESEAAPSDAEVAPEKVLSLRIVAKGGGQFDAESVILTLRGLGLTHGRFGIFHRLLGDENDDSVFSVASLTEPGSFDLQNIREHKLAGLSFFMVRPGPGRGVDAFDGMVETARAVAASLQGELFDGDGSSLSIQRERFMREDLIQYELRRLHG